MNEICQICYNKSYTEIYVLPDRDLDSWGVFTILCNHCLNMFLKIYPKVYKKVQISEINGIRK